VGTAVIQPEFTPGLQDLDGFSHIILLYHLHQVQAVSLTVTPFLDSQPRGVFATRAPRRPNPIGLSVVKLVRVDQNVLHLENVDILDGTPLLDIKPYVPEFDHQPEIHTGWLEKAKGQVQNKKSDNRFG
jgi:tRNA-Thr(GGU) m(6)t(6)A37 methyltransferase TsaA